MLATSNASMLGTGCVAALVGTTVHDLRQLLEESDVRHVPVVDPMFNVVGMVCHRDLALAAYQAGAKGHPEAQKMVRQKAVEQVMSRQVMTVEGFDTESQALRVMMTHRFHAVPVTDQGRLVGMISSTDLLKKLAYGQWPGHEEPIRPRMRSPGHTIDANDVLDRALEAAEWHAQEYVVAVRQYRPIGVLSRTAMRLAVYLDQSDEEAKRMKATPVHLLLQPLPVLRPETTLSAAAMELLEHRARALPVVDRSRLLLGLLTEDDLLQAMAEQA